MSVYKEMGYLVRKIKSRSTSIYPDAADYGVPIRDYSDPLISEIKGICKELYDIKPETERYETGFTQRFKFDGEWPAVIEAGFEKAEIVFVSTDKRSGLKGYIYVTTSTSESARRKVMSYDH